MEAYCIQIVSGMYRGLYIYEYAYNDVWEAGKDIRYSVDSFPRCTLYQTEEEALERVPTITQRYESEVMIVQIVRNTGYKSPLGNNIILETERRLDDL